MKRRMRLSFGMLRAILYLFVCSTAFLCEVQAQVKVDFERIDAGSGFSFERLPPPAVDDTGAKVKWKLIEGAADPNGASLAALNDGNVPTGDDEPRSNFFFAAGSKGGKILADLGKPTSIKRISSYSWHQGDRGPQVYTAYGTDKEAIENKITGWKKIADVDTRPPGDTDLGGRYGVSLTQPEGKIGTFRYLLFDIKPTTQWNRFGLTFFSELDIISENDSKLKFVPTGRPLKLITFRTTDEKYQFQIDATDADDLMEWSEKELSPLISEWYPKLVDMLPDEGYSAPAKVSLRYRNDMPPGIPASASLFRINLNAQWFRNQLEGEAKGCVVHEMAHVVQGYRKAQRTNPKAVKTPIWIVEGLADYVRWFLYEPETGGANLSPRQLSRAKHDASYRVSANFIDWVARTHDKDIAKKINSAARRGEYSDALWEQFTGKSVNALADDWRSQK